MDISNIINLNGELTDASQPVFSNDNRAFRYGDGLFESIRMIGGRMPLFHLHFARLQYGCELLKLELPEGADAAFFEKEIHKLAEARGLTDTARIRMSIFRTAGGYYLPTSNRAEFLIEVRPLNERGFELNEKGMVVDLYTDIEKPVGKFSTLKTCNALIYVLAAIHREKKGLDDCLLINWKSRVIESIDANLFLVENGIVHTPPVVEGCVSGVMRDYVIKLLTAEGISVQETPVTLESLFSADEMFLTNAIRGVKWVERYKSKTYQLDLGKRVSQLLNDQLSH